MIQTTAPEREVLRLLADAWNAFCKLDSKRPDDNDEFRYAVHLAQQKVAVRVARRADPDTWGTT